MEYALNANMLTIFACGKAEDEAGGRFWIGGLDRKIRFASGGC